MKTSQLHFFVGLLSSVALFSALLCLPKNLVAQTLYYDSDAHPGWDDPDAWSETDGGPFNQAWVQGSAAVFAGSDDLDFAVGDGTITGDNFANMYEIGGMDNQSSDRLRFDGTGQEQLYFRMIDNPVLTSSGGSIQFRGRTQVYGDYQIINASVSHTSSGGGTDPNERTITVINGTLGFNTSNRANANHTVDLREGSTLSFDTRTTNEIELGIVTAQDSEIVIGSAIGTGSKEETTGASSIVRFHHLEGDADSSIIARPYNQSNVARTGGLSSLTIDQDGNTEFAGSINGVGPNANQSLGGENLLQVIKQGSGTLTLSGDITNLLHPFLVEDGTLYINSSSATFGDDYSGANQAILVSNGGALGGTGTISTLDGDSVVLESGASLIAGVAGEVGQLTFDLGVGSLLDLSPAAGQAGWLEFDLGSDFAAGDTYDQILLTAGSLDIGSGDLGFDDFTFQTLSGFGVGVTDLEPAVYTLFASPDLIGSLSTATSGWIGGFYGTLEIDGQDLLLTVIPEPGTALLVLGGLLGLITALRRRRPAKVW